MSRANGGSLGALCRSRSAHFRCHGLLRGYYVSASDRIDFTNDETQNSGEGDRLQESSPTLFDVSFSERAIEGLEMANFSSLSSSSLPDFVGADSDSAIVNTDVAFALPSLPCE